MRNGEKVNYRVVEKIQTESAARVMNFPLRESAPIAQH
jgi:hypothetical protein